MEQIVQTAGQQLVISTGGVDIDGLQQCHKEYMAVDVDDLIPVSSIIKAVDSDHIDVSYIESQIKQAMSTTHVSRGYCSNCQYLFSHLPDLGTKTFTHAVGRPCRTDELEAAARNRCKSCAFMLLRLKVAGLLDTFRKIERRLSLLNDTATASISISN
jgi:hypothetical protein